MDVEGPFGDERYRLTYGMSEADRNLRHQWLKDQVGRVCLASALKNQVDSVDLIDQAQRLGLVGLKDLVPRIRWVGFVESLFFFNIEMLEKRMQEEKKE